MISGLHITFIGGVVFALVRIFTRSRWNQFSIVNAVLWAYTLAVGGHPGRPCRDNVYDRLVLIRNT